MGEAKATAAGSEGSSAADSEEGSEEGSAVLTVAAVEEDLEVAKVEAVAREGNIDPAMQMQTCTMQGKE